MRSAGSGGNPVLPELWRHDPAGSAVGDPDPAVRSAAALGALGALHPYVVARSAGALSGRSPPSEQLPPLPYLQQCDIGGRHFLPSMRGPGSARRRGRRGRRTSAMIRAAQERIQDLFTLAESEARAPSPNLSRRYVTLARRIGMRYNVRLLREYRDLYCRGCSAFWVEGRTVRTRLRSGRRTQTCLNCGRVRRVDLKHRRHDPVPAEPIADRSIPREQAVLIDEPAEMGEGLDFDQGEEE